ncbi:hypothetical protein ACJ5NV_08420 [Loktanella agnita]|uniref:hypothetical protein n=1 Tax=Loktanella agnita TaxID=287097 RepID=UPI00398713A4
MKKHILAVLTLIVTLTFVIAPLLTDPFSGFRADQLPVPQIDPPVQPAGYAFSIWGVIYTWLMVSAVYGLLQRGDDPQWDRVRPALIISLLVGTPWLAIANANAILATILIFVMAASAIAALWRTPTSDFWWLQAPVGLYAGWLTAASFVSLGSTAAGFGIVTDAIGWAYIGIIGALIVAMAVLIRTASLPYALAVVWALAGIIAANGLTTWTVSLLAAAGIFVLTGLAIMARSTGQTVPS